MVLLVFDDFYHSLSSLERHFQECVPICQSLGLRERLGLAAKNSPKLKIDVGGRVVATGLHANDSRPNDIFGFHRPPPQPLGPQIV